ncbi:MAG: hypothetical protein AAGA60_17790 [Cyanobacteria bacterium P01_E01_bin.42]
MNDTAITIVEWALNVLRAYAIAGFIFAVLFVLFFIPRVDPAVKSLFGSFRSWNLAPEGDRPPSVLDRIKAVITDLAIGFRILILPGVTALWPLFALRLMRGKIHPHERNAHRTTASKHAL